MRHLLLTMTEEEPTLLEEIWDYLVDKYFSIDYGYYENIDLSNSFISLPTIIISLIIGVILASALAIFNKHVLGDFVRAIARNDAISPEKAMTLSELGYIKNSAVRSALKKNGSLRRVVRCVEDDRADIAAGIPLRPGIAELYGEIEVVPGAAGAGRTELNTAHFYIPKEELITAEIRYEKKGTGCLAFFAVVVLCFVAMILLFRTMPDILQLVDNFITTVKPTSNIVGG